MTGGGRTARRRGFAVGWKVALCAVLLASPARAATPTMRPLEQCREHLVVSPAFAADGTAFCAASVNGTFVLYVTHDHARTWTTTQPTGVVLTPGLPANVHGLLISPDFATDRTLVADITGSVFYSTDAGATFVPAAGNYGRMTMTDALRGVSAEPSHGVLLGAGRFNTSVTARSVMLDPTLPVQRPLVGTGTPDVAFLVPPAGSPDVAFAVGEAGSTPSTRQHSFYACNAAYACPEKLGSLPTGEIFAEAWFAPDFATSGVLFAATMDLQNRTHLYASRDRARHLTPAPGLSALLDQAYRAKLSPMLVLAPGKTGSRTLFARMAGGGSAKTLTNRLFRSDDDGATWRLAAWGRDPESRGPNGTMPYEYVAGAWSSIPQGYLTYTPDGRLLFSGTNKNTRVVWCSQDSGRTWRPACR